jgi:hypothetical protein
MLTLEQYSEARAICDKAMQVMREVWPEWQKGGAIPAAVCQHPDYAACTNAIRGQVEQFELLRDLPDCFTAYIGSDGRSVTVWTGDVLGNAYVTSSWGRRPKMFAYRVTIGGKRYHGRGQGAGIYITLRACR